MPNQSDTTVDRLRKYGIFDTGPPLDYQLRDEDGEIIDLTDVAEVFFDMGWSSYQDPFNPSQAKVTNGVCVIDPNALGLTLGWVRYNWQENDLDAAGRFDFHFRLRYNDDTVRTVRSLSYDFVNVKWGPFARYAPLPTPPIPA